MAELLIQDAVPLFTGHIAGPVIPEVDYGAGPTTVAVPGKKGDRGDPGPSAYELAVSLGFVGTVADWLSEIATGPLQSHISNPTPHPAYDDMPDLSLIYENRKTP